jgi:hypothetical protein
VRPANQRQMTFASGDGQAHGLASGFSNLYTLSSTLYTDQDYGQMFPYYTTYFFVNHEMEQQIGVGSHRKLFKKLCMYVTGIGNVFFTPLVNTLENVLPNSSTRQLSANTSSATAQTQDLEWTIGVRGQRVAYKIQVSPLSGTTGARRQLSIAGCISWKRIVVPVWRSLILIGKIRSWGSRDVGKNVTPLTKPVQPK